MSRRAEKEVDYYHFNFVFLQIIQQPQSVAQYNSLNEMPKDTRLLKEAMPIRLPPSLISFRKMVIFTDAHLNYYISGNGLSRRIYLFFIFENRILFFRLRPKLRRQEQFDAKGILLIGIQRSYIVVIGLRNCLYTKGNLWQNSFVKFCLFCSKIDFDSYAGVSEG